MDFEFNTYYTSITPAHRIDEELIVSKAIEDGIIPTGIRYDVVNDAYRGVMKSSNDMLYYFHFIPSTDSFRLVKADDPAKIYEANSMLNKCGLGCDLIKAGGDQVGGMSVIDEDADVASQDDLLTDRHPGAAVGSTPDRPDMGMMWHEKSVPTMRNAWDAGSLLSSLNSNLKKSTSQLKRPISDKEQQFMLEVLGKTPSQVGNGGVYMNPTQKVQYQQWLGKSMKAKVGGLTKWAKK